MRSTGSPIFVRKSRGSFQNLEPRSREKTRSVGLRSKSGPPQEDFARFFSLRLKKKRTTYPNIEPRTYKPARTMANPIATWMNTGCVAAHV